MTFNNTLETFSLGCSYNINFFTFSKYFNSDRLTKSLFNRIIAEFFYKLFGCSISLCEVICSSSSSMLFFFVAISDLGRIVPVGVNSLNLCNNTRTSFNNGAGSLLSIRTEDAGHPNLFSNDSFHLLFFVPSKVEETVDDG